MIKERFYQGRVEDLTQFVELTIDEASKPLGVFFLLKNIDITRNRYYVRTWRNPFALFNCLLYSLIYSIFFARFISFIIIWLHAS